MKYIVEVKYTNPAHEHVSLRRRVDTIKRIVEADSEAEALNRATRQQRSLGFMIKEAEVVYNGGEGGAIITNNEPKKKKVVGDEGESEIKKEPVKEESEQIDEISNADLRKTDAYKKAMQNIKQKRLNREFGKGEDTPVSHELKMPTKNQSVKIDHRTGKPVETYREEVEQVEEDRAMSAAIAGGSVGSKILTGKMDPNFGYAANKMPPHLKAAQAKSDALSKVAKRPQAGTLAAMKKEEVEDKKTGKSRKAAEKMINVAKGKKNQVNLEPSVDPYKHHQSITGTGK